MRENLAESLTTSATDPCWDGQSTRSFHFHRQGWVWQGTKFARKPSRLEVDLSGLARSRSGRRSVHLHQIGGFRLQSCGFCSQNRRRPVARNHTPVVFSRSSTADANARRSRCWQVVIFSNTDANQHDLGKPAARGVYLLLYITCFRRAQGVVEPCLQGCD